MRGSLRTSVTIALCLTLAAGAVEGQTKQQQPAQNPLKLVARTSSAAKAKTTSKVTSKKTASKKTGSTAKKKASGDKPFEAMSRVLLGGRDSVVQMARRQLGIKYRLGAKQPGRAFDCSSLVQWITGLFGGKLPRTAAQQARVGVSIPKDTSHLLPGDLLYFGRGKKVTHIGIYVGDGKYLHASSSKKRVVETELRRTSPSFWKGVRRVFLDVDSVFAWRPPEQLKTSHSLSGYKYSIPRVTSIAIADPKPPKQLGTH